MPFWPCLHEKQARGMVAGKDLARTICASMHDILLVLAQQPQVCGACTCPGRGGRGCCLRSAGSSTREGWGAGVVQTGIWGGAPCSYADINLKCRNF